MSDFCCTFDCEFARGQSSTNPANVGHYHSSAGNLPVVTTEGRNASRAARWNLVGAYGYISRNVPAGQSDRVWRSYIRFRGALPSADLCLIEFNVVTGSAPRLRFRKSDNKLITAVGTGDFGATGLVVVPDVWYRIDMKGSVGSGTKTCDVQVHDGTTLTVLGQASKVQAATTYNQIRFGGSVVSTDLVTADIMYDDIITGAVAGEYPFGEGNGVGLFATADGPHSFITRDFIYPDGSNVLNTATNVFSFLNHRFAAIDAAAFIKTWIDLGLESGTKLPGDYIELAIGGMQPAVTINGIEIITASHSVSSSGSNKQSCQMKYDVASIAAVYDDYDVSYTSMLTISTHFKNKPSGGAWTQALINTIRLRLGSSFVTVPETDPEIMFDGVMVEVDFVPSGGGGPATGFSTVIPSSVQVGSDMYLPVFSKDHTAGDSYPILTDNEITNPWVKIGETADRRCTLWHKQATALIKGRTVVVTGCLGPALGGAIIFTNTEGVTPYTNLSTQSVGALKAAAGFLPAVANEMLVLILFGRTTSPMLNPACTDVQLTKRLEQLSASSGLAIACAAQVGGPRVTGNFVWDKVSADDTAMVFGVRPSIGSGSSWTTTTLVDDEDEGPQDALAKELFGSNDGLTFALDPAAPQLGGFWLSKVYGKDTDLLTMDRVRLNATSLEVCTVGVSFTFDGGLTFTDEIEITILPAINGTFNGSGWSVATGHMFQIRLRPLFGSCIIHGGHILAQPRGRAE